VTSMNQDPFGKLVITFECDHHDINGTHLRTTRFSVELHEDSSLDAVRQACVDGIKALGYSYNPKDEDMP
jgi:hypothetical protein